MAETGAFFSHLRWRDFERACIRNVDINLGPSGFAMIIGSCAKLDVYTRPPAAAMHGLEAALYPRANTTPGGGNSKRQGRISHPSIPCATKGSVRDIRVENGSSSAKDQRRR